MSGEEPFGSTYGIEKIVIAGSGAVVGLLLPLVTLLFLSSRLTSHHPPFTSDTIGEMVGYTELFLFIIVAYFGSAIGIWSTRGLWSKFFHSWLPISIVGSFIFSFSFLIRVWLEAIATYQSGMAENTPPGTFWELLVFAGKASIILSISSCIFAFMAGVISSMWRTDTDPTIL